MRRDGFAEKIKEVSHPEDLSKALAEAGFRIERIGHVAGPLSQWLFEGMARPGLPVICAETGHTKAIGVPTWHNYVARLNSNMPLTEQLFSGALESLTLH